MKKPYSSLALCLSLFAVLRLVQPASTGRLEQQRLQFINFRAGLRVFHHHLHVMQSVNVRGTDGLFPAIKRQVRSAIAVGRAIGQILSARKLSIWPAANMRGRGLQFRFLAGAQRGGDALVSRPARSPESRSRTMTSTSEKPAL